MSSASISNPGATASITSATAVTVSLASWDAQVANIAARSAYDSEAAGFAVLVADTGSGRAGVYTKNSATSADWSDVAYYTGPTGATGATGPAGADGIDGADGADGNGFLWRAQWALYTDYAINDVAFNNDVSYVCVAAHTAGNNDEPGVGAGWDAKWDVFNHSDMLASIYDPTGVAADAFDMNNMAEGTDTKIMTAAERTRLASGVEPVLATLAAAEAYTPATDPDYIRTAGYSAAGDFGGALYKKVASEPSHDGKFQNGNSTWYEIAETHLHALMLGLVGDGSDETSLLNSLFALGQNGSVTLEAGKNYGFDPSTGLTIAGPIKIISNGSEFTETSANTSVVAAFSGDNIEIDSMVFNFVGTSNAQFNERGVTIDGNYFKCGVMRFVGATEQTGGNSSLYNAATIGPSSGTKTTGVRIGVLEAVNWDRPFVIQRLDDFKIERLLIDTYRRGLYIKDCSNGVIDGGYIHTISTGATGTPGENGILIEAVNDHYDTENIRIYNVSLNGSGEHGFRIGGGKSVRNIYHVNCTAKNTGAGLGTGTAPDDHGGCGFKCLGPTSTYGKRHEGIYYVACVVETAVIESSKVTGENVNYAGFQMGKVYGGSITDCIVRPAISSYSVSGTSAGNGIEIIGCESVSIVNPTINSPALNGILIYDADTSTYDWGVTTHLTIVGGSINAPALACVKVECAYSTMRRITVTGLLCNGGDYGLEVSVSGSGSLVAPVFDGVFWGQSTETFNGASSWTVSGKGQLTGTSAVANGSSFHQWLTGFKTMKSGSWTAV